MEQNNPRDHRWKALIPPPVILLSGIDLKIRQARLADLSTIAQFNTRMALETEQRKLDPGRVQLGVRGLLDDPAKGAYFVAEAEGTIVGQLLITYEWSDWR